MLTLGPQYRDWRREGAGLVAGDDATKNFYQSLLKTFGQQSRPGSDRRQAPGTMPPAKAVKAYDFRSHKRLWNGNDMPMFPPAPGTEGERAWTLRAAIKETERWAANYRIPPQVMNSRFLKRGAVQRRS